MTTTKRFALLAIVLVLALLPSVTQFSSVAQAAQSAASGTWSQTAAMHTERILHTMTALNNGEVLVAGGQDSSTVSVSSAELYEPRTGTWSRTGSMNVPRDAHTATLLADGRVLVAGGDSSGAGHAVSSAELYDPRTGTWSRTGSMHVVRYGFAAILLKNGKVLVAGGCCGIASAELYEPRTGTWAQTGSMSVSRYYPTLTLLQDGKVLVAGGWDNALHALASAELYEPRTGTWSRTGSMHVGRNGLTATLLQNGKVLVTGGSSTTGPSLASAELYEPRTGTWAQTGSMRVGRYNQAATLLRNGNVLVAGGYPGSGSPPLASAELYEPRTGTWSLTASMHVGRSYAKAALLKDGRVLVSGGGSANNGILSSAELYGAGWTLVPGQQASSNSNVLNAVAAVSVSNVWAVGSFYNTNSGTDQTLAEHWNGSSWKVVYSPLAPSSSDNVLTGLKVISQNDIWAVGYSLNISRTVSRTLTEHWNGRTWSVVASPNRGTGSNKLLAVSASSSNDAWAVGNFYNTNSGTYQTLTERWNGSSWKIVYSPLAPSSSDNFLSSVSVVARNNVWAIGFSYAISGKPAHTLIEHWNGNVWNVVASPNAGTGNNVLYAVSGFSASDIWAVGFSVTSSGGVSVAKTLTEHWNGSRWSIVGSLNASSSINQFRGVVVLSSNDVWAVGYAITGENPKQTLIEHWNGSRWSLVSSPNGGTGDNVLNAVSKVPGTAQAWAVGYYSPIRYAAPQLTLIERYG